MRSLVLRPGLVIATRIEVAVFNQQNFFFLSRYINDELCDICSYLVGLFITHRKALERQLNKFARALFFYSFLNRLYLRNENRQILNGLSGKRMHYICTIFKFTHRSICCLVKQFRLVQFIYYASSSRLLVLKFLYRVIRDNNGNLAWAEQNFSRLNQFYFCIFGKNIIVKTQI